MKTITWHKGLFIFLLALTINHCRTSPHFQPTADSPVPTPISSMANLPSDQASAIYLAPQNAYNPVFRCEQINMVVTDESKDQAHCGSATSDRDDPYSSFASAFLPTQPGQKLLLIRYLEH
jgi:hypothetical protein